MFWENGCGRHQMGATLIHYTSIFNESQWGSPPESFIQKYWLVSNLPIFQNYCFFEKGPKNQQILKNSKFFFAFLVAILYGFSMVYCLFSYLQWLLIHRRKGKRKISSVRHCITKRKEEKILLWFKCGAYAQRVKTIIIHSYDRQKNFSENHRNSETIPLWT